MTPVLLWLCVTESCPVLFFRTRNGKCASCGEPGQRIGWTLNRGDPPDNGIG